MYKIPPGGGGGRGSIASSRPIRYTFDNIVYIVMNSPVYFFLSVFGSETIIYNNGSIDISDTF